MSDQTDQVVGPEGVMGSSAVAFQLSAVEKLSAQDRESIRRELEAERVRVDTMVAALRHERELVTAGIQKNLDEREQGLRRERELVGEKIKGELEAAIHAAREAALADVAAARMAREMEVSRLEKLITAIREINASDVARIQEVKNLHWAEHQQTHQQEAEAVRVAVAGMDKRLDAMNHLNNRIETMAGLFPTKEAMEKAVSNLDQRLEREAQDARRRFEANDAKLNTLEREMGIELRKEVRPIADKSTGQAAVIAALFGAVTLILFAIAIFNFMSRP